LTGIFHKKLCVPEMSARTEAMILLACMAVPVLAWLWGLLT
jgi:hypothetical protein